MNDLQIRVFLEMAETLNFTKVANQRYLTQQAVSKYIAELEEELNVVLFRRDKGAVELTREGEAYKSLFSEALNNFWTTKYKVQGYRQKIGFRVRIGFSELVNPYGEFWGGLCAYREAHPNIQFQGYKYGGHQLIKELDEHKFDLAIVPNVATFSSDIYEIVSVAQETECLYASEKIAGETIDRECWGASFIQVATADGGYFKWLKSGAKQRAQIDLQPSNSIYVPDMQSLLAEMKLHQYVTIAGDRFGYVRDVDGLRKYPLNIDSKLYCVWLKENENPSLPELAQHLSVYFATPPTEE